MPSQRKAHPLDNLNFNIAPMSAPPASSAPVAVPEPAPAAPLLEEETTRSSNVTLPTSVWEWIDAKHAEARSSGGAALRKAAIIRAVFQVVISAEVDLAGAKSEEEITQRLIRAIAQSHNSA